MTDPTQQKKDVHAMYASRATNYDEGHGGWHIEFGHDFVTWLDVKPGETALDLACGTGLVTIPLAEKIGSSGLVVGVDLTLDMIEMGKRKLQALDHPGEANRLAPIEWVVHDITDQSLVNVPSIKSVLEDQGGFDIISVCSALVLLSDSAAAVKFWASSFLKKGGRMIIDVPTEALTSQFLFTYHIPIAVGLAPTFSQERLFVKDIRSLEMVFEDAGLKVDQSIRTKSYIGEHLYNGDEKTAMEVFQTKGIDKYPLFESRDDVEQARKAWLKLWPSLLTQNEHGASVFRDGHWLYVTIGSKP